MRLIDEIEAAAKWDSRPYGSDELADRQKAYHFIQSAYWPRLKEALLSAEEMAKHFYQPNDFDWEYSEKAEAARARFRAANGE